MSKNDFVNGRAKVSEKNFLDAIKTLDLDKPIMQVSKDGVKTIKDLYDVDLSVSSVYKRLKTHSNRKTINLANTNYTPADAIEEVKVLIIDIETSPVIAYTWNMWKANIGENQVIENSYIMSFCAKWLGSDDIIYEENRTKDDTKITESMFNLLDKAHFVVAHNGDRFDIPRINTSAVEKGLQPPSPYKSIDTLKIAKKHFRFQRNTLEHLASFLDCDNKKLKDRKFKGFDLWRECIAQNDEAWEEMARYNILDVQTLEDVYLKLRPYHKETPNMGAILESSKPVCSKCGSSNLSHVGYVYTDVSKFDNYRCSDCGGFSRGRLNNYDKEIRGNLLTTVRS